MKKYTHYLMIVFFVFLLISIEGFAQKGVKYNGSLLWHNQQRVLNYFPKGEGFKNVNGDNRFTRAIYGTNTGFRFETSDFPEFGLYMPNFGGSVYLALSSKDTAIWVKDAKEIVSQYEKGVRSYTIKDPILGKGTLHIAAVAFSDADGMIVKSRAENLPAGTKLIWIYGGANNERFSREGDLGADPKDCFYIKGKNAEGNTFELKGNQFVNFYGTNKKVISTDEAYENNSTKQTSRIAPGKIISSPMELAGIFQENVTTRIANAMLVDNLHALLHSNSETSPLLVAECPAVNNQDCYFALYNAKTTKVSGYKDLSGAFAAGKEYCEKLASRIQIKTPDSYINPLASVLSLGEDAIWEDPGYLHGAIGWRIPLTGWRGAYIADVLGFSDKARKHFDGYAASQVTDVPVVYPPLQDTACHLSRSAKIWGTPMYSNGYITRNPNRKDQMHHYDMNLCYIDELLWHLNWTGDLDYARKMFPVIKRHLAWEKQVFDADNDGLYDAYCCIWASDDLQYNSGGVTHSSAYNYRANRMAAEIAGMIGEDPTQYSKEAQKILSAINQKLWLKNKGHWAEYVDFMGNKNVHESAALWTVYHAVDSDIHDEFKAYQATRYVDAEIPHIPVVANGLSENDLYVLSTTNWQPYSWSINNVAFGEVMHTALAYWQSGRADGAYKMFKGMVLDGMYLGSGPGNITQISYYDAARGETYRDFADPMAMTARAMIQGLYGIRPDLMNNQLTIKPGFPSEWNMAKLKTNYIDYQFKRDGKKETYSFVLNMKKKPDLTLRIPALYDLVQSISVNGKQVKWKLDAKSVLMPQLVISAGIADSYKIEIQWKGSPLKNEIQKVQAAANEPAIIPINQKIVEVFDPQNVFENIATENGTIRGKVIGAIGERTFFVKVAQNDLEWWMPVHLTVRKPLEVVADEESTDLTFSIRNNRPTALSGKLFVNGDFIQEINVGAGAFSEKIIVKTPVAVMGTNRITILTSAANFTLATINWNIKNQPTAQYKTVDLSAVLNDHISAIYEFGKYKTPRSPYTTLQIPTQGVGFWCHPTDIYKIDDNGLRRAAGKDNRFVMPQGIPFSTPSDEKSKNIAFTTLWDNYPDSLSIPVKGKAKHLYLLMGGSTNHMQANFVNGTVVVHYKDGSTESLALILPDSWIALERDIYTDGFAFKRRTPAPWRVHLPTGKVTRSPAADLGKTKPDPFTVDGGAAIVLDIALDPNKELSSISVVTKANEVVIGLISATLMN